MTLGVIQAGVVAGLWRKGSERETGQWSSVGPWQCMVLYAVYLVRFALQMICLRSFGLFAACMALYERNIHTQYLVKLTHSVLSISQFEEYGCPPALSCLTKVGLRGSDFVSCGGGYGGGVTVGTSCWDSQRFREDGRGEHPRTETGGELVLKMLLHPGR